MAGTAARYLHLTRYGEASPDESRLTDAGNCQAAVLGQRLRGVPLPAIDHGPLARAEQTVRLIAEQLDNVHRYLVGQDRTLGGHAARLPVRAPRPPCPARSAPAAGAPARRGPRAAAGRPTPRSASSRTPAPPARPSP
ncbi:histidine phosphatase family protein [Kitasatospora sp. DSM 101779]|uniref:histidine phosphatase family protein n=1 Tax=Kitasatospora sp. DSM 101779 TaxID=2853165 RepID=UPI0039870557